MAIIETLIEKIKKYNPKCNEERIRRAYKFAKLAHFGQKRKSGEDYISHPLETALNLTHLQADEDTIIASLLHDVPEDTNINLSIIKKQFGDEVAFLVKGITKLSKVHYRNNMAERQVESLKKLLIHSAKDIRVILIKLADRLHNMRTIDHIEKIEKKERIAKETMEIYVPIANLLNVWELKNELEDLCFKSLQPQEYNEISLKLNENQQISNLYLQKTIKKINEFTAKQNIKIIDIYGRQKNIYSIYKKLQRKNYSFKSICDIIGIRIICENIPDCYKMLGIVHNLFTPKPYKIKDYIALPKANGYQSIHTVVFGLNGIATEFQIRTLEMHLEAEYGIAAHYFYSYGEDDNASTIDKSKKMWARKILELKKQFDSPHSKIIDQLKFDIFQDRIFVFTPKGDVIDLPKNATCIDFAYAIHSDVGSHIEKAEINDYEVTLNTRLNSGDTVKIITNKNAHPTASWLDYTNTSLAKRKIKEEINKESKEQQIIMGKERLQKELYFAKGVSLPNISNFLNRKFIINSQYKDFNDLYLAIGEGKIDPKEIITKSYSNKNNNYFAGFKIITENKVGACIALLKTFKDLNVSISKITGKESFINKSEAVIKIYAKIEDLSQIRQIMEAITNIPIVKRIYRTIPYKILFVSLTFGFVFSLLIIHPLVIKYLITNITPSHPIMHFILPYSSLLVIYLFTLMNESLFKITLPDKNKLGKIWLTSILMSMLSLIIVIAEIIIFQLKVEILIFLVGIIILYLKLYFIYKKEKIYIESL